MLDKVINWLFIFMILCMASCCEERIQTDMDYFDCELFTNNCG